jgi:Holliday junction resolvasome RuvABC DNA-binding subunit
MPLFKSKKQETVSKKDVWARPEMLVTFRAEIMPGKSKEERTFKIEKVMRNERVKLYGFEGEHRESSFEPLNHKK